MEEKLCRMKMFRVYKELLWNDYIVNGQSDSSPQMAVNEKNKQKQGLFPRNKEKITSD